MPIEIYLGHNMFEEKYATIRLSVSSHTTSYFHNTKYDERAR